MIDNDLTLDCRDLSKRFGEIEAVRSVSFHIGEGETYGLLGPNGAGKTTTISIVCGLLEADAGEVIVAGEQMTTRSVRAKAAIGYVPQVRGGSGACPPPPRPRRAAPRSGIRARGPRVAT